MSRYKNSKIVKNKNGTLHNTTRYYTKVPVRDDDMYFIATDGDRCDNLANRFYGNSGLWWYIAHVNHLKTMNVPAGTSLRIPANPPAQKGY
tara:strand:- start:620 stop:892 length:273 start_codon:yes stop_codon:yes gene_type:complete